MDFERQIKTDEPESFEVNSKLFRALQDAIELIDRAKNDSYEILQNMDEKIREKCGVVESDGRVEKRRQAKMDVINQNIDKKIREKNDVVESDGPIETRRRIKRVA
jgi:hypothetical protein